MKKPKCFVIQKFDGGEFFDQLYEDVIEIAVKEAGAEAYRADRILGAKPPMQKVREEITSSQICLAEASFDNPNVFLEIGWAIGIDKNIFILCDRTKRPEGLPFDISHNSVIFYNSEENGWRKKLREDITKNVKHELSEPSKSLHKITSNKKNNLEFNDIEKIILTILLDNNDQDVSSSGLRRALITLGFGKIAITHALDSLEKNDYIMHTSNGLGFDYYSFSLLSKGMDWTKENERVVRKTLSSLESCKIEDFSIDRRNSWMAN